MPILDYHCHLDPKEIAQDRRFENITQVWLGGDHYKWRLMRAKMCIRDRNYAKRKSFFGKLKDLFGE